MDEFIGGDRVVTVLQTHGLAQEISHERLSLLSIGRLMKRKGERLMRELLLVWNNCSECIIA